MLGKLVAAVNTRGRSIRVLKEWSTGGGGNLCPPWLETSHSCDTVGREL